MRSFRRTLTFLKPYRARVILAVVMTLIVTILQIVPPRLYQLAIDVGIQPVVDARKKLPMASAMTFVEVCPASPEV